MHVGSHEMPAYWNVSEGPLPTTLPRAQQIWPGQASGPLQLSST